MATAYANAAGQYSVQFSGRPGEKRATIYLGKVDPGFARDFGRRVGILLKCRSLGILPDNVTLAWLKDLDPRFIAKLVERGLHCASESKPAPVSTVAELCAYCIEQADVEPSTLQKYRDTQANLIACWGPATAVLSITDENAKAFRRWLKKSGRRPEPGPLAPSTVCTRLKQAKQFFAVAVRRKWIPENPFTGIQVGVSENRDRQHFVDRPTIAKLMAAADPELRLIIALARFGGLRIPSEIWPLEWGWIDAEGGTLRVLSTKNKRFEHKKWRTVPLFPEIRGLLRDAFHFAPESTHVIAYRGVTATALRNRLERLCLKCGVVPWPKIWQNMRSTRETELLDEFPIHVVCEWLGNSPSVAIRNYGQITKEHLARAAGGVARKSQIPASERVRGSAKSSVSASAL